MVKTNLDRNELLTCSQPDTAELAQKHWEYLVTNISIGNAAVIAGAGVPRGRHNRLIVAETAVANGVPGPYESSLLGNPVIYAEKPLEVLRTVHSFDPGMACACHTCEPTGKPIARLKVL